MPHSYEGLFSQKLNCSLAESRPPKVNAHRRTTPTEALSSSRDALAGLEETMGNLQDTVLMITSEELELDLKVERVIFFL